MHYVAWVVAQDEAELRSVLDPYNLSKHQTQACSRCPATDRCDPVCMENPQGRWDGWIIGGRWESVFGADTLTASACLDGISSGWPGTEERLPYSFVTEQGWIDSERWLGPKLGYEPNPAFESVVRQGLNALTEPERVFVVDYRR